MTLLREQANRFIFYIREYLFYSIDLKAYKTVIVPIIEYHKWCIRLKSFYPQSFISRGYEMESLAMETANESFLLITQQKNVKPSLMTVFVQDYSSR